VSDPLVSLSCRLFAFHFYFTHEKGIQACHGLLESTDIQVPEVSLDLQRYLWIQVEEPRVLCCLYWIESIPPHRANVQLVER
jgi:hypothetical protein